jgi:hypothetical protein
MNAKKKKLAWQKKTRLALGGKCEDVFKTTSECIFFFAAVGCMEAS